MTMESVPYDGGRKWTWEHDGERYSIVALNGDDVVRLFRVTVDKANQIASRTTDGMGAKGVAEKLYLDVVEDKAARSVSRAALPGLRDTLARYEQWQRERPTVAHARVIELTKALRSAVSCAEILAGEREDTQFAAALESFRAALPGEV